MKISLVYWSGTGNTEAMAKFIAEGAAAAGAQVEAKAVGAAAAGDVHGADLVVLGCPSMGDEALEEYEFSPFLENVLPTLKNKKVALFGSYGWGDGRWMREWQEKMSAAGCLLAADGLMVNGAPEGEECKKFGELLAKA
ncbi:MAG: flavodoxin [Acidaminococcales bacterium]|jgi:flavodoxin short chain|nr:flavodoxin [Acidaminococcales bacterium]